MLRFVTALILSASLVRAPVAAAERRGTHRHITNIVFSGLAGAILGLSTLSFYGRPQDRLNNIGVGFAIGVITGTVITTYRAAAEPREFYGLREAPEPWSLVENPHFARPTGAGLFTYRAEF